MFCRLCLVETETSIDLYETKPNQNPTQYVQIIDKYLQLKVTWDDSFSACICYECGQHLSDFDEFYKLIEEKQQFLKSELPSIKIETNWWASPNPDDGFVLKNEPLNESEDEVPGEDLNLDEDFVDAKKLKLEKLETNSQNAIEDQSSESNSSEDDLPLMTLKTKRISLKRKHRSEYILNNKVRKNEEIIASYMKVACDICSKKFESFGKLRIHFAHDHDGIQPYAKCCGNYFRRPATLAEHVLWHTNPETYKCPICDKQLKCKTSLDVHYATKHNDVGSVKNSKRDDLLSCPKCPKKFGKYIFLRKHIENHEVENEEYTCQICNKRFHNIRLYRRHITSMHDDLHPYGCEQCGRKFKCKPSFDRHLAEHEGKVQQNLKCEDCGHWSKNPAALRIHRFSHEKLELPCELCGRIYSSTASLKNHIRYKHTERPTIQCELCEKSFKIKVNYDEHMAVHTGALLYSCQYCPKKDRSHANMYAHIKRYHVEEWKNAKLAKLKDPNFKPFKTL